MTCHYPQSLTISILVVEFNSFRFHSIIFDSIRLYSIPFDSIRFHSIFRQAKDWQLIFSRSLFRSFLLFSSAAAADDDDDDARLG